MQRLSVSLIITVLAWATLSSGCPVEPVDVHVRWAPGVTSERRVELERQFQLNDGTQSDGTTWSYRLADPSAGNIRALVQQEQVADTDHAEWSRLRWEEPSSPGTFRIEDVPVHTLQLLGISVAIGILGPMVFPLVAAGYRGTAPFRSSMRVAIAALGPELANALSPAVRTVTRPAHNARVTAAMLLSGALVSVAMTSLAGAAIGSSVGALVIVYASGYVAGSLLLARVESLSFAMIRTVAGLLLSSVGYLLSLVLHLPWFVVPGGLVVMALALRGRAAFVWPPLAVRIGWDGVAAGLLAVVLLSPITISFFLMAPGPFPPVFYNVDTAYSLEKVHAMVTATTFPPPSLGNLGVVRTYHYGTHAMTALIARGSGLLPHQALFLIVLPLLALGVVASAVAVAHTLAPALPLTFVVPLLLLSTPALTRAFSDGFGPTLWTAMTSGRFTLDWIVADYDVWGILSNEAQTVASDFLILASIATVAAAPVGGWLLPAFLIGSSVIFKTTAGIALVAGFMLAEAWHAVATRRYRPSAPMVLVGAVFAATYATFYLASFDSAFRVQLYPLEHIRTILGPHALVTARGFLIDSLWLCLPALIVLTATAGDGPIRRSYLLLMGVAPLLVINTTRLVHVSAGGLGAGLDWVQIPHPTPYFIHAFALSLASARWSQFWRLRRVVFLLTVTLVIAPVVIAAGSYSSRLLHDPTSGHEFVDNHSLAEALAAIPVDGSLIVTNDIRYPADHFGRDDRQLQLPALFGHQAFSANFAYEDIEDRRPLQQLLQRPEWSDAISEAARRLRWTHLLIRKDYVHPLPIPLRQVFENEAYVVFRFP